MKAASSKKASITIFFFVLHQTEVTWHAKGHILPAQKKTTHEHQIHNETEYQDHVAA